MDTSDVGLTRFDDSEVQMIEDSDSTGFNMNVPEHFCMALPAWCWRSQWQHDFHFPHIDCWSDNVSAVSWINQRNAKNSFGLEINRAIGLAEAVFRIRLSSNHIPGSTNRMADADSRAWSAPFSHLWSKRLCAWRQVQVPEHWRRIYKDFSVQRTDPVVT
ncbi:hypothetical protein PHMEG_00024811 [Phytophthora megakarya]|uniref:RNase H type-1 domain-containing protein n=1 Tax=Phytophthora megakarya TaxID=4795 RepID=A0A225VF06_9STRA|nr:hypothetical protein PHMEG_00024811 [Phytophthora megakarya]